MVLAQARPHVDAVVLESMYPTIAQAVQDRLRLYLGSLGPAAAPLLMLQLHPRLGISADRLRPIEHVASIDAPVFIISGTLDQHTPIAEARQLFEAAASPKEFWAVEGAAHVDLHDFTPIEYEHRIAEFFGRYLRSPGPPE